jgi:hypothetical protein
LKGENEIGFPGIIAGHHNRFFRIAGAGFRIQFYRDRSLSAGRDGPVVVGNEAASAGLHFLDIENGIAHISDIEFMNELTVLAEFPEIVGCFRQFNGGRRVGGGCGLHGLFGGIGGGVEQADMRLIVFDRLLFGMHGRLRISENIRYARPMSTAGEENNGESTRQTHTKAPHTHSPSSTPVGNNWFPAFWVRMPGSCDQVK